MKNNKLKLFTLSALCLVGLISCGNTSSSTSTNNPSESTSNTSVENNSNTSASTSAKPSSSAQASTSQSSSAEASSQSSSASSSANSSSSVNSESSSNSVSSNGSSASSSAPSVETPVVKNYRFEAEEAEITNKLGEPLYDAKYYGFSLNLSNCLTTKNLGAPGYSTYKVTFNSDKAVENATFAIKMTVNDNWTGKTNLGTNFFVKNGNTNFTLDNPIVVDKTITPYGYNIGGASTFFRYQVFTFTGSLKAGENVITYGTKGAKFGANIDYMEIETDAVITDYEKASIGTSQGTWSVTKAPTAAAEGEITVLSPDLEKANTFKFALPKLADGNGYTETLVDGVKNYSFTIKGNTHTFTI